MPGVLKIKAAVRARDGFRCTDCGMSEADHVAKTGCRLDVHRLVPGSVYTVRGCVSLCHGCHGPKPKRPAGSIDKAKPPSFQCRGTVDHAEALKSLVAATRRSVSKEIILAVESHLAAHGLWP